MRTRVHASARMRGCVCVRACMHGCACSTGEGRACICARACADPVCASISVWAYLRCSKPRHAVCQLGIAPHLVTQSSSSSLASSSSSTLMIVVMIVIVIWSLAHPSLFVVVIFHPITSFQYHIRSLLSVALWTWGLPWPQGSSRSHDFDQALNSSVSTIQPPNSTEKS